jgi:hypothetical protein
MTTATEASSPKSAEVSAPAPKRRNRAKKMEAVATAEPVKSSKPSKPMKPKKVKLVRDSFTIPKAEYLVLQELKLRGTELKIAVKKSELIRAGIKALEAMDNKAFLEAVKAVPLLKAGRPSK